MIEKNEYSKFMRYMINYEKKSKYLWEKYYKRSLWCFFFASELGLHYSKVIKFN